PEGHRSGTQRDRGLQRGPRASLRHSRGPLPRPSCLVRERAAGTVRGAEHVASPVNVNGGAAGGGPGGVSPSTAINSLSVLPPEPPIHSFIDSSTGDSLRWPVLPGGPNDPVGGSEYPPPRDGRWPSRDGRRWPSRSSAATTR